MQQPQLEQQPLIQNQQAHGDDAHLASPTSLSTRLPSSPGNTTTHGATPTVPFLPNDGLCRGRLKAERGGKFVEVYCELHGDCFRRFADVAKAEAGKARPTATVKITDVQAFTITEGTFLLTLRRIKKPLEFRIGIPEEVGMWADAWSAVLEERLGSNYSDHRLPPNVLAEGMLKPVSPPACMPLPTFLAKRDSLIYGVLNDRGFETYANLKQKEAGMKPKGIMHLENVKGLAVSEGAVGHVLAISSKNKLQRYEVSSTDDAKKWGVAWEQALEPWGRKVDWKVQPGTVQAPVEQVQAHRKSSRTSKVSKKTSFLLGVDMNLPHDPVLCEGDFHLSKKRSTEEQAGTSQALHVLLFHDRLEYACPTEVAGVSSSVMLNHIEHVDVEDTGLVLQMKDGSMLTMMAVETLDTERWAEMLARIFEEREIGLEDEVAVPERESQTTEEFACQPSRRSVSAVLESEAGQCSPNDAAKLVRNKAPLHHGPLLVQRLHHVNRQKSTSPKLIHVVLYNDRFEHIPDNAPPRILIRSRNVREVRVQDAGFILGLEVGSFQMQVPPDEDMDPWIEALWAAFDPDRLERPVPIEEERTDWLESLAEQPLCHGTLGFQENGRMALKYCALFGDRIDIWDSEETPAVGAIPEDHIAMANVWSLETVSGGLILNLIGGERLGVHIHDAEEFLLWSSSLASTVLEVDSAKRGVGSDIPPRRFSRTDVMDAKPTPRTKGAKWLPRVATLPSAEKNELKRNKSIYTMRAEGKQLTPFGIMGAGEILHGKHAKVMVQAGMPGGRRIKTHVSEKVNECLKSPRPPRGVEADRLIANKVTCSTPALLTYTASSHQNRMSRKSPPRRVGAPYAVVDVPHCPPCRRPASPPRPSVTSKVTAAAYESTFRPVLSSPCPMTEKILVGSQGYRLQP